MCFAPQGRALFRHLNLQKWHEHVVLCAFWFQMCFAPQRVHFFDIWTSKSGANMWCLYILTSKCASRHNGVHFFDISTSKSGPRPPVFNTFDLEMCFAPQRHALFRHLNFQKWSENGVLYILTSKCASRHNGVQFFISHLASWLRTRRPSGATNHWKNTVFRDFPTFSRICIFFLLTLSLLWSSLF